MSRREAPAALRWTVYVAVAIVFAIACGFLSNWQFTRNEERSRQLALVDANYDATPVPLDEVLPAGGELAASDEWTPVRLTGAYLADEQLLVRNRAHGGTAAFEVLVPFLTDDGRVVIVDRGWVPPGRSQPEPDAIPAPPAGQADVVVRVRPGEALPSSGRSAPDGQVATIHLPLIAEQTPGAVETGAYGIVVSETPAPAESPQPLASPSDDPGPHLSYAIQWILFAVMGFGFIGYVIVAERRHRREEREDARAAAAQAAPAGRSAIDASADGEAPPSPATLAPAVAAHRRRRRHSDRDTEAEDALLDANR